MYGIMNSCTTSLRVLISIYLLQIDKNRIDASGMIEETAGNEIASSEVKPSDSKFDDSQPIATRTRTSQTRRKPKIE